MRTFICISRYVRDVTVLEMPRYVLRALVRIELDYNRFRRDMVRAYGMSESCISS